MLWVDLFALRFLEAAISEAFPRDPYEFSLLLFAVYQSLQRITLALEMLQWQDTIYNEELKCISQECFCDGGLNPLSTFPWLSLKTIPFRVAVPSVEGLLVLLTDAQQRRTFSWCVLPVRSFESFPKPCQQAQLHQQGEGPFWCSPHHPSVS